MNKHIRPIAVYLPQFHPIAENDTWWGKGFTEWTNVTKARPLFKGHYQPHLPADLGFYDLRIPQVREEQAKLAKEYGIYGFCYYHYWFNGKRILGQPFAEVLESGKPDFPFMLCWANENWSRIWDGSDREILLEQKYSPEDDMQHIHYLLKAFKDPRYIRVDGKPVFCIYRSTKIPHLETMIRTWRNEAAREGLELYLCRFESFGEEGKALLLPGFDAAVEFQPMGKDRRVFQQRIISERYKGVLGAYRRIRRKAGGFLPERLRKEIYDTFDNGGAIIDYRKYVDYSLSQKKPDYPRYPGVCPMWDNTARRKSGAMVLHDSTPGDFAYWLNRILEKFEPFGKEKDFLFINAWNEWAEGDHLEPCQKWGRAYLESVRDALKV